MMKKIIALILAILAVLALMTGCRAEQRPDAAGETVAPQTVPDLTTVEARNDSSEDLEEEWNIDDLLTEDGASKEMSMKEIEGILGYDFMLPDREFYTGEIVSRISKSENGNPRILLEYTADTFKGTVCATKEKADPEKQTRLEELWPNLKEVDSYFLDGQELHLMGETPYDRVAAYWEWDGFLYTVTGELYTTPDMGSLIPFFAENIRMRGDPIETINVPISNPLEELPMEEIERRLGYGYQLPAEGEYPGKIVTMLESGGEMQSIYITYYPDPDSSTRACISKLDLSKILNRESLEELPGYVDAGTEEINGVEVHFVGETPDMRQIAYWERNGYWYKVDCAATGRGLDMMSFISMFVEP